MSSKPICIGRVRSIQGAELVIDRPNGLTIFESWAGDRDIALSTYPPDVDGRRRYGQVRIKERHYHDGVHRVVCDGDVRSVITGACEHDWVYAVPATPTVTRLPIGQSFALTGRWRIYFNRHGAIGKPWCVAPDAGGWEVAVTSVGISTVAETVYRPKATPDDEDGKPSAWIAVDGYLTIHDNGHASIGSP